MQSKHINGAQNSKPITRTLFLGSQDVARAHVIDLCTTPLACACLYPRTRCQRAVCYWSFLQPLSCVQNMLPMCCAVYTSLLSCTGYAPASTWCAVCVYNSCVQVAPLPLACNSHAYVQCTAGPMTCSPNPVAP